MPSTTTRSGPRRLCVVKAVADGGPSPSASRRAPWAARTSSSTGRSHLTHRALRRGARRQRAARAAATAGREEHGTEDTSDRVPSGHRRARGARAGSPPRATRSSCTRMSRSAAHQVVAVSRGHLADRHRAVGEPGPHPIYTARPGIIIGRKGAEVEKLKNEIQSADRQGGHLNIEEVVHPELDAQLVAENIALQLQKRVAFRRAMKKAVTSALRLGAEGIRIACSGRLGGAEMARTRVVSRRARAAPHASRRHRLRARHGAHHVRRDRREGVDLQGRGARAPSHRAAAARAEPDMLMPKRVKYRKTQRGRMKGKAYRGGRPSRSASSGSRPSSRRWVTNRQIEAARVALTRASSGAARCGSGSSRTSR